MQNYPNIETTSWKKDANGMPIYVGYGGGETWYISRASKKSQWYVRTRVIGTLAGAHRTTLVEISQYLSAFDR